MHEKVLAATLSATSAYYNIALLSLIDEYGSLEKLYYGWRHHTLEIPDNLQRKLVRAWTKDNLASMAQLLTRLHITPHLITEPGYPPLLKEINDPPYVIYSQGDTTVLTTTTTIACVGTRAISAYGKRVVERLIPLLNGYPVCIVSGLALGIDGEVHRAALNNAIPTVAVLGGGLDRYEPLTNARIAEQIVRTSCLISEYPPGVRPQKHHFLERNRIIAGLSQATVVIEGGMTSGALVTARYAAANGREVGAVPGDVAALNSEATHRLLKEGAWPITDYTDMLAMVSLDVQAAASKKEPDDPVYAALKQGPASLDLLFQNSGLPIPEIQQRLTQLEIDGFVTHTMLGDYCLTR